MARIKIKDLPMDQKISKAEMRKITGGLLVSSLSVSNRSDKQDKLAIRHQNEQNFLAELTKGQDAIDEIAAKVAAATEDTEITATGKAIEMD